MAGKKYTFVILETVDPDELNVKAFSSAKKAAEHLVSMIDGHGLSDETGEELQMDAVLGWRAKGDLEAWDGEGRVLYTMQRVEIDEEV